MTRLGKIDNGGANSASPDNGVAELCPPW